MKHILLLLFTSSVCLATTPYYNPPKEVIEIAEQDKGFFVEAKEEIYAYGKRIITSVEEYQDLELIPLGFSNRWSSGRAGRTETYAIRYLIAGSERIPENKGKADPNLLFQDAVHRDEIWLTYVPKEGKIKIYTETKLFGSGNYIWYVEPVD